MSSATITFDVQVVFTVCRDHGTVVEINSCPEHRNLLTRLLKLALDIGCVFGINTDAHVLGQPAFLDYGAQRVVDTGVPADMIVHIRPVEWLCLTRCSSSKLRPRSTNILRVIADLP
ncbi:hypothetical protein MUBE_00690 [Mycobacterium uberis]|uniref:PHP domain-containing protein n=1 Tax=Mycobacterium uberis TaxID=2162698 RepID=A0A3E1HL15_9MYCO|nr:hypothetical protein MUBE_00690 [Mycobacterium uberis]